MVPTAQQAGGRAPQHPVRAEQPWCLVLPHVSLQPPTQFALAFLAARSPNSQAVPPRCTFVPLGCALYLDATLRHLSCKPHSGGAKQSYSKKQKMTASLIELQTTP